MNSKNSKNLIKSISLLVVITLVVWMLVVVVFIKVVDGRKLNCADSPEYRKESIKMDRNAQSFYNHCDSERKRT